jgi:hypothetical protein
MHCRGLSARANIETFDFNGKTIVLYDDHRYILNVLNDYRKNYDSVNSFRGYTGKYECPNLIFFDRHDDAKELSDELKNKIQKLDKENIRDFWNFVEFDVSTIDDDWVCIAMEMNLVKNVVVFGNKENDNIKKMKAAPIKTDSPALHQPSREYIGMDQTKHVLFSFDDSFLLTNVLDNSNCEIEDIVFNSTHVLDFDLDCFSDGAACWCKEKMKEFCSLQKLKNLVTFANLITICREPGCCGGLGQSNKILQYLDEFLFDECLRTSD